MDFALIGMIGTLVVFIISKWTEYLLSPMEGSSPDMKLRYLDYVHQARPLCQVRQQRRARPLKVIVRQARPLKVIVRQVCPVKVKAHRTYPLKVLHHPPRHVMGC